MIQFQFKKCNFWQKLALFGSKLENLQIRQWVALFKILPYLTNFPKIFRCLILSTHCKSKVENSWIVAFNIKGLWYGLGRKKFSSFQAPKVVSGVFDIAEHEYDHHFYVKSWAPEIQRIDHFRFQANHKARNPKLSRPSNSWCQFTLLHWFCLIFIHFNQKYRQKHLS